MVNKLNGWLIIILCIPILLSSLTAFPTDEMLVSPREYFVDCEGDDRHDGAGPEKPWRSLERVSKTILLPGDTVRFKSGCVWYGSINLSSSGTEDNPITFTTYGAGKKPRIAATVPLTFEDDSKQFRLVLWSSEGGSIIFRAPIGYDPYMVYGTNLDNLRALRRGARLEALANKEWYYDSKDRFLYFKCDNKICSSGKLKLEIPHESLGNTIWIKEQSNIVIDGLEITGGRRFVLETKDGSGIALSGVRNSIIQNCSILGGPTTGIHVLNSKNISILRNKVYDCGNTGIRVSKGSIGCKIAENEVFRIGNYFMSFEHPSQAMDKCGIGVGGTCSTILIDRNDIHECGLIDGATTDPAIEIYCATNVQVRSNHIHDNYFGAITIEGDKGRFANAQIENNVIVHNQRNRKDAKAVITFRNTRDTSFTNNTYYNNYVAKGYGGILLTGQNIDLEIKKNIFCDAQDFIWNERLLYVQARSTNPGLMIDYNCWYRSGGTHFINYTGKEFSADQFQIYQAFSKQDKNSIHKYPEFINPRSRDFRLQETTPCLLMLPKENKGDSKVYRSEHLGAIR